MSFGCLNRDLYLLNINNAALVSGIFRWTNVCVICMLCMQNWMLILCFVMQQCRFSLVMFVYRSLCKSPVLSRHGKTLLYLFVCAVLLRGLFWKIESVVSVATTLRCHRRSFLVPRAERIIGLSSLFATEAQFLRLIIQCGGCVSLDCEGKCFTAIISLSGAVWPIFHLWFP